VPQPAGIVMPPLRSMLGGIGSQVVEGTLVPALNFWSVLQLLLADRYDAVLLTRSILAPALSSVAVACCVLMGRRALQAEGIHLHLRWRDAPVLA